MWSKKGLFGIGATPAVIEATYQKNGVALALEFLQRLTKDMGLEVTMSVRDGSNNDKVIAIDGDHAGVLIGHHGDTLDALQYLSNLAANKSLPSCGRTRAVREIPPVAPVIGRKRTHLR